jgi:hypothetical protein
MSLPEQSFKANVVLLSALLTNFGYVLVMSECLSGNHEGEDVEINTIELVAVSRLS